MNMDRLCPKLQLYKSYADASILEKWKMDAWPWKFAYLLLPQSGIIAESYSIASWNCVKKLKLEIPSLAIVSQCQNSGWVYCVWICWISAFHLWLNYEAICAQVLLRRICDDSLVFGIFGTPGIGKSLFFVYILYRICVVKDSTWKPKRIVYQCGNTEELSSCREKCYSSIVLLDWFRRYGGVARFAFWDYKYNSPYIRHDPIAMETALSDTNAVTCLRAVGKLTDEFDTSHTLMHIIVESTYDRWHLDIASKYVGEKLLDRYYQQMINKRKDLLGGSPNLFEIYNIPH